MIREYEKKPTTLARIIDFHVKFERIHPFDDYNGRVGFLIMRKECLRYQLGPFVLDNKCRSEYCKDIAEWGNVPTILTTTVGAV